MSQHQQSSRREFLVSGTGCVAALAVGKVGLAESETKSTDHAKLHVVQKYETGLTNARRLCVTPDGIILVVAGRNCLELQDGLVQRETLLERPARCVAAAKDGRIAIGFHNRCEIRSQTHEMLQEVTFSETALVSDLALAGDQVFVADAGEKVVWRCDLTTSTKTLVTRNVRFAALPEFFKLSVSADGRQLFVANPGRHRIEQFSCEGEYLSAWGRKSRDADGFGGCCNPVSFAQLSDGSFLTAERGQPRIKHFNAEGRLVTLVLDETAFPENAAATHGDDGLGCSKGGFDIAVDDNGQLFVLDCVTGTIHVLS